MSIGRMGAGFAAVGAVVAMALGSDPSWATPAPLIASPRFVVKPTTQVSATPSSTRPHWACPRERCLAIVDPPPVRRGSHYALTQSGPLLEGGGEFGGLDPADLVSAYKIPATSPTQTVAVVEAFGYAAAESDLATYRERYGLPACTKANGCFKQVNLKGEEGNYPTEAGATAEGWQGESALDMDMVSAACASCKIMMVEGPPEEVDSGVETAVNAGATEVSLSFGSAEQLLCEAGGCTGEAAQKTVEFYSRPGVPIFVAGGDAGYNDHLEGASSPSFPASLPDVVSVGGTTLLKAASTGRGWREEVWSKSGSGCSTGWETPAWQISFSQFGCAHRLDNDVAAVADWNRSPVSVYTTTYHRWSLVGGTSASAPLVAGIMAHASAAVRSAGARAFYEGAPLFDVTTGSNGPCVPSVLCLARVGYDPPTGMGTPNGVPLTVLPDVAKVAPSEGPEAGGTTVTISGTGFEAGDTARFGSTAATSSELESATSMKATAPAGTGTVDVTVVSSAGSSPTSAADHFIYDEKADLAYTGATESVDEQSITLSATLTNHNTSLPIAARSVKFAVGAEICEGTTNGSGLASCVIQVNDAPGGYTMTAKTVAGGGYLEASTSAGFTVQAPPVFGRCLKASSSKVAGKVVYHGKFTTATCTEKSVTQEGKFEWSAGLGPKTGFTVVMKPSTSTTPIKLESASKQLLVCKNATGVGHVTGLKTATIGITLTECTYNGVSCTTFGESGVVSLGNYNAELGWVNKALKKAALRLTTAEKYYFPGEYLYTGYECGGTGVALGAKYVVPAILLPVAVNKTSVKSTLKFAQSKGKQIPSALEGGPTETFEEERSTSEDVKDSPVGLAATLLQTYEEGYEINTAF